MESKLVHVCPLVNCGRAFLTIEEYKQHLDECFGRFKAAANFMRSVQDLAKEKNRA